MKNKINELVAKVFEVSIDKVNKNSGPEKFVSKFKKLI